MLQSLEPWRCTLYRGRFDQLLTAWRQGREAIEVRNLITCSPNHLHACSSYHLLTSSPHPSPLTQVMRRRRCLEEANGYNAGMVVVAGRHQAELEAGEATVGEARGYIGRHQGEVQRREEQVEGMKERVANSTQLQVRQSLKKIQRN